MAERSHSVHQLALRIRSVEFSGVGGCVGGGSKYLLAVHWLRVSAVIADDLTWVAIVAMNSVRQRVPIAAPVKGTNPALKKPSNIPEIYAKMFGRIH